MLPGPPPGTVNRDRYPDAKPNPVVQVADQPVSTFSIDVDTASYANVRRHLRRGPDRRATPCGSRS
jgi:Ca-activated chloride channel family protein